MTFCRWCTHKRSSYIVCAMSLVYYPSVLILEIFQPGPFKELLAILRYSHTLRIALIVVSSLASCEGILLLVGLIKNNQLLILIWIVSMFLFWNFKIGFGLICLVLFVANGNTRITETAARAVALVVYHGVSLAQIYVIWKYWTTLVEIQDVPTYIQFLLDQRAGRSTASIATDG